MAAAKVFCASVRRSQLQTQASKNLLGWFNHITMRGMKFNTKELLLLFVLIAICLSLFITFGGSWGSTQYPYGLVDVVSNGPLIVPLVFLAFLYWLWPLSSRTVTRFAIAEAAAIALAIWVNSR